MIYLNNAATSWPKPEKVYESVNNYMKYCGASHGRGNDINSFSASELMYECRTNIARLINIENPERIIFTFNATDSINIALKGVLKKGDHVIITEMEHNAVLRPLKKMEQEGIIELSIVSTGKHGSVSLNEIERFVQSNTSLIEIVHASNVTGLVNRLDEIGEFCSRKNIYFMADVSQTIGYIPIDVIKDKISILAAPGHKGLLGPQGTGLLYFAPGVCPGTLREGGTGSQSESYYQPDIFPDKFESGTMNMPGIAGLNEGVKYILSKGIENIYKHKSSLLKILHHGIKDVPGLISYVPGKLKPVLYTFNINNIDSNEICTALSEYEVAVRGGLHCAYLVHKKFGTLNQGMVRVSPGIFNSEEEIYFFIGVIKKIINKMNYHENNIVTATGGNHD